MARSINSPRVKCQFSRESGVGRLTLKANKIESSIHARVLLSVRRPTPDPRQKVLSHLTPTARVNEQ